MAALVPRCPVGLRLLSSRFSHRAATGSEFRSAYSLEQLYPARDGGSSGHTAQPQPAALSIPMDRLTVSYSRSSGPGGQNVNKVNTKAEVRFHLATADWIPEAVREKMASMHRNKINRAGELIVNSDQSRYQMRNLAICLEKIRVMVTEATEKPKVVSKETTQQLIARVEKMNRERLRQKKIHSNIKQSRKADFD
ncbi:peptidyl-tRNA hydrolase ICT1, mitochondrial isoform X1 [Coturnix japonica]|uniref:peptidyl-tRNA hydrolase ICT1, mitochondrial isoform X1 n=1 Tax=Coturnix japonica TaxID=93934 RepID=UPI000777CC88|nr:peptidyl-tRNA hydrolase ICT1, mitochondrial isoform X1 [Coturnix japonica]